MLIQLISVHLYLYTFSADTFTCWPVIWGTLIEAYTLCLCCSLGVIVVLTHILTRVHSFWPWCLYILLVYELAWAIPVIVVGNQKSLLCQESQTAMLSESHLYPMVHWIIDLLMKCPQSKALEGPVLLPWSLIPL